jgi:hypothetical protein
MSDPTRLLQGSGSKLERELLESVIDEQIPAYLSDRMQSGVAAALGGLAAGASASLAVEGSAQAAGAGESAAGGANSMAAGASAGGKVLGGSALSATFFKGGMLTLALVGAIGGGYWYASSGETASEPAPVPAPVIGATRVVQPEAAHSPALADEASEPEVGETDRADEVETDGADVPKAAPRAEPRSRTPRSPKRTSRDDSRAEPKGSAVNVGAEVAVLDAVRRAIAKGDDAQARRRLAEYDRRFPNGVLRRDAQVLRKAVGRSAQ